MVKRRIVIGLSPKTVEIYHVTPRPLVPAIQYQFNSYGLQRWSMYHVSSYARCAACGEGCYAVVYQNKLRPFWPLPIGFLRCHLVQKSWILRVAVYPMSLSEKKKSFEHETSYWYISCVFPHKIYREIPIFELENTNPALLFQSIHPSELRGSASRPLWLS